MKQLNMLVWVTQLGLSAAVPLGGFIWFAVWLRQTMHWGAWVVVAGVALGLISAVSSFWSALKAMERMTKDKKQEPPPVSFHDHE